MVAKIIISKNIRKALNYNEQKVQKKKAECIHAGNFLQDKTELNFYQKLQRFTSLIERNEATTNTLHISLNFDNTEHLSDQKLEQIATAYMKKIGFGEQPFLVYKHHDAGHPHIHIVTTNIKMDGKRINTHNIGKIQSEKARKEIENEFNLVRATAKDLSFAGKIKAVEAEKVIYGKSETKRAITNVLDAVLNQYKYTSLAELNAVLRQYNVLADRGSENGQMYQRGGLVYRVLDQNGNKIGVPIKASSIYSKPILQEIAAKYTGNEIARKFYKAGLMKRIDEILQQSADMLSLTRSLEKLGISTVLRRNDKGFIYGVTFVDHHTRCVFNGSDLHKRFSAAALQQRFNVATPASQTQPQEAVSASTASAPQDKHQDISLQKEKDLQDVVGTELLDTLAKPENGPQYVPYELRKKKKKKRKKKFGM